MGLFEMKFLGDNYLQFPIICWCLFIPNLGWIEEEVRNIIFYMFNYRWHKKNRVRMSFSIFNRRIWKTDIVSILSINI